MNNEPYTVIGVMPPAFAAITDEAAVILPIAFTAERLAMYDEHYLDTVRAPASGREPGPGQRRTGPHRHGPAPDHPEQNVDRSATSDASTRPSSATSGCAWWC